MSSSDSANRAMSLPVRDEFKERGLAPGRVAQPAKVSSVMQPSN
jgi:hypothetical protein